MVWPTSAPSRSTLITSPCATRYCLPPVLMTAYMACAEHVHAGSGHRLRSRPTGRFERGRILAAIPLLSTAASVVTLRSVLEPDQQAAEAEPGQRHDPDRPGVDPARGGQSGEPRRVVLVLLRHLRGHLAEALHVDAVAVKAEHHR